VSHLTSSELQCHLDLVAFVDKTNDIAGFRVEVTLADLGSVFDLFDRHVGRLLSRFFGLLVFFVLELAVVHDATHRRLGLWRDFDEIKIKASGHTQRVGDRFDSELVATGSDETDFTAADAVVDAVLIAAWFWSSRCYETALLCKWASPCSNVGARREVRGATDISPSNSQWKTCLNLGTWTLSAEASCGQVGIAPTSNQLCPTMVSVDR
jgi:hypothetical protein